MPERARELPNVLHLPADPRPGCSACPTPPGRVRHDQVWTWSLQHPGEQPLVEGRRRLLVVRDLPPPAHKAACCLAHRDALGRLPVGYCSPTCERRR